MRFSPLRQMGGAIGYQNKAERAQSRQYAPHFPRRPAKVQMQSIDIQFYRVTLGELVIVDMRQHKPDR